jgi:uncharacterized membrane protein
MENTEPYIGSPENPRTTATVAYITFIGWLLSYFGLYPKNKTPLSAFHLRQSLFIHIISFVLKVIYSFSWHMGVLFYVVFVAVCLGLFLLWLIGIFDAMNGRQKPLPIIGNAAQRLFKRFD